MMTWVPLLCLLLVGFASCVDWDVETALDEYINRDDGYFEYSVLDHFEETGYDLYVLNMTSQKWMNESYVYDPVWWHYLSIAIPHEPRYPDACYLRVHSGDNLQDPPSQDDTWHQRLGDFATDVGAVAAILRMNPNQPTIFVEDVFPRYEDFIIGYTWRDFVDETMPSTDVILQFPMTKAAKKAVDAIVEFTHEQDERYNIDKYMPSGASKRGWVTWLLAATDRRVFGIVPVVFDLLNMYPSLVHHFRSLDGWSWAFTPYWSEDVPQYLHDNRTQILFQHIDPLYYNERLTMPKINAIASGDEFFLLSDSHFWWDQINGDVNYMWIMENTNHGHGSHQARLHENIKTFFVAILEDHDFPSTTWTRTEDETGGTLTFSTDTTATMVQGWTADTTNVTVGYRDFRIDTLDFPSNIMWHIDEIEDEGDGNYQVRYDRHEDEDYYRGFFIEARYDIGGRELQVTTEAHIIPDTLPHEICETREECAGVLR